MTVGELKAKLLNPDVEDSDTVYVNDEPLEDVEVVGNMVLLWDKAHV